MISWAITLFVIGVVSFFFRQLLNIVSIVAVIWLAFLGQWWALIRAGIILLLGLEIFSFLSLPVSLFMYGIFSLFKPKSKFIVLTLTFLSHTLNLAVMALVNLGIIYMFTIHATEQTWIPLVIISYSLGAGIWGALAYEEMKNEPESYSGHLLSFAELSLFVISIISIIKKTSFLYLAGIYKNLVLIYLPIMAIILYREIKNVHSETTSNL